MNGRSAAFALALALLLLPPASADSFASIQATEAAVDDAWMDGDLEGAVWLSPGSNDLVSLDGREAVDVPGISISARHAEVTVYHSERYLTNDLGQVEPTRWSLDNVSVVGARADARDASLLVVPLAPGSARLSVDGSSLRIVPGDPGAKEYPGSVKEVATTRIDSGASIQVQQGAHLLRLTGAVRLVVDGLDMALASDDGPRHLHTRRDVEAGTEAQVRRASYSAHSTVHEAVIELQDAVVVLPATEAYVRSAVVDADGPWSFEHATGDLSGSSLDGTVAIDGELSATIVRGEGHTLAAVLTGSPTGLSVNGRALPIDGAPGAEVAGPPMGAAAFAAVLVLVLHLASGRWRFRRLDQAMDRKDFPSALRLSRGFRGHPLLAQDAALAAAICLLALGRPADVGGRLVGRLRWTVRRRPTRDFLLARAEAALGRPDEASRSLARCLVAEPSLLPQAQADPLLAALLRAARPPAAEEAYA